MAQIDRLLAPGEHVHLVSREHGVVLLAPFLRAAMIVARAAAAAILAAGLDLPAPVRLVPVLRGRCGRRPARSLRARPRGRALAAAGAGRDRPPSAAARRRAGSARRDRPAQLDRRRRDRPLPRPAASCTTAASSSAAGGRRGLLFGLRRLPDPDLLLGLLLGLAEERSAERPRWAPATLAPARAALDDSAPRTASGRVAYRTARGTRYAPGWKQTTRPDGVGPPAGNRKGYGGASA